MLKKLFKTLFCNRESGNLTESVKKSCNYWVDDENEVDYSPNFTAQDIISSPDTPSKPDEEKKSSTDDFTGGFGGSCGGGCGGGCLGGCGGGCL